MDRVININSVAMLLMVAGIINYQAYQIAPKSGRGNLALVYICFILACLILISNIFM